MNSPFGTHPMLTFRGGASLIAKKPDPLVPTMRERYSSDGRAAVTMKKTTATMTTTKSGSEEGNQGDTPSQLIDERIKELGDWRGGKPSPPPALFKKGGFEGGEGGGGGGGPRWGHAGNN